MISMDLMYSYDIHFINMHLLCMVGGVCQFLWVYVT